MRLVVAFTLCSIALAQQPPAPPAGPAGRRGGPGMATPKPAAPPVDPAQLGSIEGRVVHGVSGEPLRKARVSLMSREARRSNQSVSSDTEGRFRIEQIEPGRYSLFAEKVGFVRRGFNSGQQDNSIALAPAQKLSNVLIRLTPQGVILGRVVDEDGDPVPGVAVSVNRIRYQAGQRQMVQSGGNSTNDIGEFRIANLTPGRYYLSASDRRGSMPRLEMLRPGMPAGRAAGGSEEAYATIYYPGTIDPASAAPMDIRPGTEMRGIELRLAKRRVVRVRGRVDGAPARRPVVVSLVPASTFSVLERRNATTRDGAFELINVAPGSYILTAQSNEGQTRSYARMALEVGESPIDNVSLTLQPAFTVTGRFRLEGQAPAETPNMRILLRPTTPGLQFPAPFGPGGGPGGRGPQQQPQSQPDGTFTLYGVVADKFQVVVERLPESAYVKSVRVGEQDVLQNGLDLSGGAPGAMLDVVISMDAGVVNGIVTNEAGDPVSGATVTLAPDDSRARQASLYRQTTTIENGAFVIKGIAPGSYRALAWEELDPLSWQDPEYLRSHERFAKSVTIREKQAESLQIKWVPAEK